MGKQMKPKKAENLGKGKVTPVQVAFIVDRYLCDNNFTQTRSVFRSEASALISKTQLQEAPKSLLSLGAILDEYICLKEQKVVLEQEKRRVESLLQGMQDVMQAYNSGGAISPPVSKSVALIPQTDPSPGSAAGYPIKRTSTTNSVPWLANTNVEANKFSTPSANVPSQTKRKGSRLVSDVHPTAKRPCNQIPTNLSPIAGNNATSQALNSTYTQETVKQKFPVIQSSSSDCHHGGSSVQASSVAKNLFKQISSCSQTSSPGPKTPPQVHSQTDMSVSPLESSFHVNDTNNNTPQGVTPANSAVISSQTLIISPSKQIAYYSMERNHYISSSSPIKTQMKRLGTRDNVKGRLDFGASDVPKSSEEPSVANDAATPASSGEIDMFDLDIDNLDIFGPDFCLSELLVDFELDHCDPVSNPAGAISGSPHDLEHNSLGSNQAISEPLSSATEVLCEKDMNMQDSDSFAPVTSIKKCIRILSPAKNRRSPSLDQENLLARN